MRRDRKPYIIISVVAFVIIMVLLIVISFLANRKNSSIIQKDDLTKTNITILTSDLVKHSPSKEPHIMNIISQNESDIITEKIEKQEIDLEFTTQYKNNNSLAKGKMQTIQEGQDGKQNAVLKSIYKGGELISQEQISTEITRVAIDKIVEIGTAAYSNNYVPVIGDKLKVTSVTMAVRVENTIDANKLITLNQGDIVTLKERYEDWYYIEYGSYLGWAPADCLLFYDPNANTDGDENIIQYTKEQLTQDFGFSMLLNRKSGLSLEQFKQVLSNDEKDVNKVFESNAEYFYYAEQQYNVNGLFVAAVGIHESGWGTSSISLNKKNLFGYGAYDRDPSGMAATFESYAEGIDLLARVFMKYYLNPEGTPIYGGENAVGTYYRGATLTAVNTCYATDPNWANGVYKWMTYLYDKL